MLYKALKSSTVCFGFGIALRPLEIKLFNFFLQLMENKPLQKHLFLWDLHTGTQLGVQGLVLHQGLVQRSLPAVSTGLRHVPAQGSRGLCPVLGC